MTSTFQSIVSGHLRQANALPLSRLPAVDYALEIRIKNTALLEFWEDGRLPGKPLPVLPAPKPRHYRTTSKRKVMASGNQIWLAYSDIPGSDENETAALLEPLEHPALYRRIEEALNGKSMKPLHRTLNFVSIRGTYASRAVILNVSELSGPTVKALKRLAALTAEADPAAVSCALFYDPSRSDYYLDSGGVGKALKSKKLFGHEYIRLKTAGLGFHFSLFSFSQVNEAMIPELLKTAREMLAPTGREHLLDLYCGYGLFTLFLAPHYAHALGIEAQPDAIESAIRNTRANGLNEKCRFQTHEIGRRSLHAVLPNPGCHPECILADPPRSGMPDHVIKELAVRGPAQVLQACCGTDAIPSQIRAWERAGYRVQAIRPLDLFPGTPHLETLIRFCRQGPGGKGE